VTGRSGPRFPYTDPADERQLIADVVARRLRVNRDPRGILVETLRSDWSDAYDPTRRPFGQSYYSFTEPWVARDEDRWHVHERQSDRFVVPGGEVVLALHDPRAESPTRGRLNLIRLGQSGGDATQFLIVIPPRVRHAFMVIGPERALLLNYPTHLYDPEDEGRVPFVESDARLPDGRAFSWDVVRRAEGAAAPESR
jgi:dTDP-4-dehydrorhamnose 3,5-epimerase